MGSHLTAVLWFLLLCGFCCCDVWFFLIKIPKIYGFGDFLVCAYLFLFIEFLFIFIIYQVGSSSLAEDSFLMSFLTSFAVPSTVVVVRPKLSLAKPPPNGDLPA